MFTIDTNVPLPPLEERRKHLKYPFAKLDVGHSFFVPLKEGDPVKSARNRMWSAALHRAKRCGEKYVVHLVEEGGKKGFRVWLVSRQAQPSQGETLRP